jgi:hypothetical protein
MDPVTTAIIAALSAGAASGITESGKKAIIDAYGVLKNTLKKKFGEESKVVEAVRQLEEEPKSEGRKMVLAERVSATHMEQDPEISREAEDLLNRIRTLQEGGQYIAVATGDRSVAAGHITGNVSTGDQIKE